MTDQSTVRPELIIALVCPLGASIEKLQGLLRDELKNFGYTSETIHVSRLLENLDLWTPLPDSSEKTRIEHYQLKAFEFRRIGGTDALARATIAAIREKRRTKSGHPDKPSGACAYILRQLKHPKEIELLRKVYGQSFLVVAGNEPEKNRIATLAANLAKDKSDPSTKDRHEAEILIGVDTKEKHPDDDDAKFGQNTRDTFPLADVFIDLAHENADDQLRRFIQLIFGHPFRTPTPEEMAMYQANAMSLRSSDERRQVGAVIVTRKKQEGAPSMDVDIVASGMNEVPRRQGGFYWEGEFLDARDQALKRSTSRDRENVIKLEALGEIANLLRNNNWLAPKFKSLKPVDLNDKLLQLLRHSQFMDISEFMRQVHAEMSAIVDAAKRGVAVRGGEMYVTAFPCHNCAKHIIAAGITRVIYLEPYPKSRATKLHGEEIVTDPSDQNSDADMVEFKSFTGVAPRQYARLFGMSARSYKNGGYQLNDWNDKRSTLSPLYVLANAAQAYVCSEREDLERLPKEYKWDRAALCPPKQ